MKMVRGQKIKLSDVFQETDLHVQVDVQSQMTIDITCFGLNSSKKLSNEEFMIFYNQPSSSKNEISLLSHSNGQAEFSIHLGQLPTDIQQFVFTATIDGGGTMSDIESGILTVKAGGQEVLRYLFTSTDFQNEKAVIIGELYQKDIWRIAAVGQGFDGGLAALLTHFGGEVAEEEPTTPPAAQPNLINEKKINLEKKMAEKAPQLLNLAKKATISLEKVGLQSHKAKVALCLDISGSMNSLYQYGKIQDFAEKILALGTRFDDDGAIDIFLFGRNAYSAGELSIDNFSGYVNQMLRSYPLEGGTYYGKVMKIVREHYLGSSEKRKTMIFKDMPTYIMFVTDGATMDESLTKSMLQSASYEPLFWQFMAIGKSNNSLKRKKGMFNSLFTSDFRFLEALDDMSDRFIDNADFFSIEDPSSIPDDELYNLLMQEYPAWVKEARSKGLLQGNQ
ncbi:MULTISPECIES: VWA domain-containing protein [Bacillaceae]|nr:MULTISPECIES: VWA domain-containing protein [Bacillaceae]